MRTLRRIIKPDRSDFHMTRESRTETGGVRASRAVSGASPDTFFANTHAFISPNGRGGVPRPACEAHELPISTCVRTNTEGRLS